MKIHLLIIDGQADFTRPAETDANGNPSYENGGALFVDGAPEGIQRLSDFIIRKKSKIDDITATLDSHHLVHIANPIFWKNSHGDHPNPFTIITHKDVENGTWMASIPSFQRWCLEYTQKLEANARYPLCIWPPHCLISSKGAALDPTLFKALKEWEEEFAVVNYVTKGSNIKTEHYSALKADVIDPKDSSTQLNSALIKVLMEADLIACAGWAGSHCLAFSIKDIADSFGNDDYIKKIVLLKDATSPVRGFEKQQDDFIKEMVSRGMQLSTTDKFLR